MPTPSRTAAVHALPRRLRADVKAALARRYRLMLAAPGGQRRVAALRATAVLIDGALGLSRRPPATAPGRGPAAPPGPAVEHAVLAGVRTVTLDWPVAAGEQLVAVAAGGEQTPLDAEVQGARVRAVVDLATFAAGADGVFGLAVRGSAGVAALGLLADRYPVLPLVADLSGPGRPVRVGYGRDGRLRLEVGPPDVLRRVVSR